MQKEGDYLSADFQLPEVKKDLAIHCVIPSQYRGSDLGKEKEIFEVKNTDYVKRIRSQYLLIERELIKTFEYVEPNTNNYRTNSVRFASIVRESCNLFELVSKDFYSKLFNSGKKKMNIKDYLSLDAYLYYRDEELSSPYIVASNNGKSFDLFPFKELMSWDRQSEIQDAFIPKWWSAYNKIKHTQDGIRSATLENAILAVCGVYVLINSIYGEGVLIGELRDYDKKDPFGSIYFSYRIEQSQLFTLKTIRIEKAF